MDDDDPAERPYPSPSTQRRTGEIWKARLGLGFVVALTLLSAAVLFRLAGLGVGAATSPFQAAPTSTPFGGARGAATPPAATPVPVATSVVPLAGTPAGSAGQSPAAPTSAAGTPTRAPGAAAGAPTATPLVGATREHVVAAGDTLGAIAPRYGTNVDTLVRLNDFKDRNQVLNIGQKVKVP